MKRWTTLEPVKLNDPKSPPGWAPGTSASGASRLFSKTLRPKMMNVPYIGPLPVDIHVRIVSFLPITSVPIFARCSKATAAVCRDDSIWERHWLTLGAPDATLDRLQAQVKAPVGPATISVMEQDVIDDDDDFGAFATASSRAAPGYRDAFEVLAAPHATVATISPAPVSTIHREKYKRAQLLLKPLLPALYSPAHIVLPTLFPSSGTSSSTTMLHQAQVLYLLSLFLSPAIQPVLAWHALLASLRGAIDRFDANLLSAFDAADRRSDENGMKDAAWASWEVFEGKYKVFAPASVDVLTGRSRMREWEMGRSWAEKKEIFYEGDRWDPIKNFNPNDGLDFRPMDDFMSHILQSIRDNGAAAVRIFPPTSGVLQLFSDRLAIEVVGEYITPLLSHARGISNEVFLKATAASFVQAWRMVDVILEVSMGWKATKPEPRASIAKAVTVAESSMVITRYQAEDIVYRMFEPNLDDYLDEEVETAKQSFETICREWERRLDGSASSAADYQSEGQARFLSSHNPALVKRNVLASFTDLLLLPVTIVPRTVGAVVEGARSGANAAVSGISMLNPQRWGGSGGAGSGGRADVPSTYGMAGDEYAGGASIFDLEDEDNQEQSKRSSLRKSVEVASTLAPATKARPGSVATSRTASPSPSTPSFSASNGKVTDAGFDRLQLLLSLDIALEIIHADRESLKRAETFQNYPGSYGHKVRETIEELFILMLQAMGGRHIQPGFAKAIDQMQTYKPAEHEETASVAPLMQFFELVHVADTIQSMIQVFFDKELAPHIDRTDFLNGAMREKKRFENTLDDSVAGGLNTGTDLLMKQVEHIIVVKTEPRQYYPEEGVPLDLKPTKGCVEAIACLEKHCKLLKGSTSKEVLEVFYQEVGIRLDAIIQKHLKRQIISLQGGFQVIADLNAYHAFIASLKVPQIVADFANLKMLGHVFIVEDAKDLAQIVRDVTRYGGSFRPEDVYEFIQRRSDWKKIEKTVDKTMYNLSFKEDCVIC